MDRRTLLLSMGALSLSALGCACPRPRPPVIEMKDPTGLTPLAPRFVQSKQLPLAFDVHAHLFNATDVHVRGYLDGPVSHSLSPALEKLVAAAAPLIESLGQALAISCGEEMKRLATLLGGVRVARATATSMRQDIAADVERHLQDIEDELIRRLPGSEFGGMLDQTDQEYQQRAFGRNAATPFSRDRERIRAGLRGGADPLQRGRAMSVSARALAGFEPAGVLRFIRQMVSPRHHNLRAFQQAYTEGEHAFGFDACFASMVDFDHWLGCDATSSSLHDQVLLHEQLAALSGGYVLPLVPYNPWTDIKQQDKSLELVRWAVQERGCVGVKLYPPMGYRPLRNDVAFDTTLPRPKPPARMDEGLSKLYRWCADHGVPVMGHTSYSKGRDEAHDELSHPQWWAAVLQTFPDLHVNAGHFGGGYRSAGEDWPKGFVQLMSSRGGLYVDLSSDEDLLDPNSSQSAELRRLLVAPLPDGSSPLSHVMYGSDWLMISLLGTWAGYAHDIDDFLATLKVDDLNAIRRAVFYGNAVECFGLAHGAPNRQRLEQFYRRWQVAVPAWMTKLDQT